MAISINNNTGDIFAGGDQTDGDLVLQDTDGRNRIHLNAGGDATPEEIAQTSIYLDGQNANLYMGGRRIDDSNGPDGDIYLFASDGDRTNVDTATIHLNGNSGNVRVRRLSLSSDGGVGPILIGGGNFLSIATPSAFLPTIQFNVQNTSLQVGNILLEGGNSTISAQNLQLRTGAGANSIFLGGEDSTMLLGNTLRLEGDSGRIVSQSLQIRNATGANSIFLGGEDSIILVGNTLRLDGDAGDIILQNADCAEDFEVEVLETAEPGTVMVIGSDSRLRVSDQAYDQRVAGIVAGAGKYRPGIILGRKTGESNRLPIALMGRVFCKVDADQGAIKVGDLLTTSSTPGYAMKADNPARAFGAVIGKALVQLDSGQGLIPVLVTLQ